MSCLTRTRPYWPGPKEPVGVREERLHRQRAGGRIDLTADDGDVPRVREDAAVGEDELDALASGGTRPTLELATRSNSASRRSERDVLALGERDDDPYRIDLRNGREQRGLRPVRRGCRCAPGRCRRSRRPGTMTRV